MTEPAARCLSCRFRWLSRAMADGLRALGKCPKCGGELRFAGPPRPSCDPPPGVTEVEAADTRPPHLVLGFPRRG